MAESTSFKINVYGKGGHGSAPHALRDPITVAN